MPDENDSTDETPSQQPVEIDASVESTEAEPLTSVTAAEDDIDTGSAQEDGPFTSATARKSASRGGVPAWTLVLAALIPAVIVGAAVWFFAPDSGGGDDRLQAVSSNVLHAFTSGSAETITTRYEGALPPGYPDDIPAYDGAKVVASVVQLQDPDIGYIVLQDAGGGRDAVAADMKEKFNADPWQIDVGQDGREMTLYQFSRIDDPDITGIVLISGSQDDARTTIITSIQVASGAADHEAGAFVPIASRPAPEKFPSEVAPYDGAIVIDSAFQKDSGSLAFALSYITKDSASDVLDHYRDTLGEADLTVENGDPSASTLEDAESIRFSDADLKLTGEITVGVFGQDDSYTRIDVQVRDERE